MNCKKCNRPIALPMGNPKSQILIILGQPTEEDISCGKILQGQYGSILRAELAKWGIDLFQLYSTSLWLHQPVARDIEDFEFNAQQAINLATGKRAILLLDTITTQFFFKKSSTAISGIPLKADLLSADLVMATRSPTDILSGTHGEFILGIEKFCKQIKPMNIY